jgi:hypothetical protein
MDPLCRSTIFFTECGPKPVPSYCSFELSRANVPKICLALVSELVKLHGGSIHVISELRGGTTFTVSIPTGKAHLAGGRIAERSQHASTSLGAKPFVQEALRWIPDTQNIATTTEDVSMQ